MEYGPPLQARDFVASWVEIGKPALKIAGEALEGRLARIVADVVRLSLANLMTSHRSPGAVAAGQLKLQGYQFDMQTGVLAAVGPDAIIPVDRTFPLRKPSPARYAEKRGKSCKKAG
jgi:carbonic anhydrase